MEELIAEAEAALLWAATRFDATRGTRFSGYAVPFVLGALREVCRRSMPLSVPRAEGRQLFAAQRGRETLRQKLQREPTMDELSTLTGIAPARLCLLLTAGERLSGASGAHDAQSAPTDSFEDRFLLRDALLTLPKPYGQVLWLRFYAGYTQREAAQHLSVTQPQISKWEKTARAMLKARLTTP